MDVRERLKKIEEQLKSRGVRNIKYALNPALFPLEFNFTRENPQTGELELEVTRLNSGRLPEEMVLEDLANMLQAYLDGRFKDAPDLNDLPA